ncbi:MAG: AAA ATPase central domain-containing [Planctomycetota bacterium]|nr:MAG: AAA ATPase central domain-containing [Planctomycetota bacterium]
MPLPDRLALAAESWQEHLRNRAYVHLLGEFVPRSSARREVPLDPAATWEEAAKLLTGFEIVKVANDPSRWLLILKRGGHVVGIDSSRGRALVEAMDLELKAQAVLEEVARALGARAPREDAGRDDGVWVEFCLSGRHATERASQFVRCPEWRAIRDNYPDGTRAAVDSLVALPDPGKNGQLIIWHGSTGTGKTYALRAAMRAWRERFLPTVLTDPERFAKDPGYYFDLASDSRDAALADPDLPAEFVDALGKKDPPRRRLFILEDSAALLVRGGEGGAGLLGRLLNMTDGLLGQGREDLFLVTLNEEIERVDPAFLRPGRCVAHIRFPLHSPEAATAWLRSRGHEGGGNDEAMSLADLYAKAHGGPIKDEDDEKLKAPKGFGAKRRKE